MLHETPSHKARPEGLSIEKGFIYIEINQFSEVSKLLRKVIAISVKEETMEYKYLRHRNI